MQHPLVFRVFGLLNLICFFFLLIQTIIFLGGPAYSLALPVISSFSTIWFLMASLLWLFKSPKSFTLLYVNALVCLFLAGGAIYLFVLKNTIAGNYDSYDELFTGLYAAFWIVYALFLFGSLFFKPVKEWMKESKASKFDPAILAYFFFLLVVVALALQFVNNTFKSYLALDFNSWINGDQIYVKYSLGSSTYEFDALVLTTTNDAEGFSALIYFSDTETEGEYFRRDTVSFTAFNPKVLRFNEGISGNNRVWTKLSPVKAKYIMIKKLEGSDTGMSDRVSEMITLHSVRYFDNQDRTAFIGLDSEERMAASEENTTDDEAWDDAGYVEVPATEEVEIRLEDAVEPTVLSAESRQLIINTFLDLITTDPNNVGGFSGEGKQILINGHELGAYVNFRDVFNYYSKSILARYLEQQGQGVAEANYTLNSFVRMTSGVNLEINAIAFDYEPPFNQLNPRFVAWVSDYLLPEPDDVYMGQPAKEIYQTIFRRMIWMMASAHEFLELNTNYEGEAEAYKLAIQSPSFNGPVYLYQRYDSVDLQASAFKKLYKEFPADNTYYYFNEKVAIGFWLRRRMDGSDEAVWNLVKKIMEKYDTYPFEQ